VPELRDILRDINEKLSKRPVPPDGFDPLTASNEDLVKYGGPPRPKSESSKAFEMWKRALSRPTILVPPQLTMFKDDENKSSNVVEPQITTANDSLWSGAVVTPDDGSQKFEAVVGEWEVPSPGGAWTELLPGEKTQPGKYAVAVWIGIDANVAAQTPGIALGTISYFTVSVAGGVASQQQPVVWYQWSPGNIVLVSGLEVDVGDTVQAMICANPGTSSATASVQNVSTGKGISSVPIPPPSPTAKVVGENAVWIVSEPSNFTGSSNGLYFPTYGEISISQISAITDVSTGDNSYDLASQNVEVLNIFQLVQAESGSPPVFAQLSTATPVLTPGTQLNFTSWKSAF